MKRYGQLRKLLPDITPKMLTQVLRELENDLLISRHIYKELPPRVEYKLKESGKQMTRRYIVQRLGRRTNDPVQYPFHKK